MLQLRSVALIGLLALTLGLAACEKGFRVGGDKGSLSATSVVVTRHQGAASAAAPESPTTQPDGGEKLVINLDSGTASFTDAEGRTHQTRIAGEELTTLRNQIANGSWRGGGSKAAAGATHYTLTVYNGDQPLRERGGWNSGGRDPRPVFATLESVFHRTERLARPLSHEIDLLN